MVWYQVFAFDLDRDEERVKLRMFMFFQVMAVSNRGLRGRFVFPCIDLYFLYDYRYIMIYIYIYNIYNVYIHVYIGVFVFTHKINHVFHKQNVPFQKS